MTPLPLLVLEVRSGTKFLTISANPTLWTLFGSHKELGGASMVMESRCVGYFRLNLYVEAKVDEELLNANNRIHNS
jgi:hypothetical protein